MGTGVTALVTAVRQDTSPSVKQRAAQSLGELGSANTTTGVAALVGVLCSDPDASVRLAVSHALEMIGPMVAPPLANALVTAADGDHEKVENILGMFVSLCRGSHADRTSIVQQIQSIFNAFLTMARQHRSPPLNTFLDVFKELGEDAGPILLGLVDAARNASGSSLEAPVQAAALRALEELLASSPGLASSPEGVRASSLLALHGHRRLWIHGSHQPKFSLPRGPAEPAEPAGPHGLICPKGHAGGPGGELRGHIRFLKGQASFHRSALSMLEGPSPRGTRSLRLESHP